MEFSLKSVQEILDKAPAESSKALEIISQTRSRLKSLLERSEPESIEKIKELRAFLKIEAREIIKFSHISDSPETYSIESLRLRISVVEGVIPKLSRQKNMPTGLVDYYKVLESELKEVLDSKTLFSSSYDRSSLSKIDLTEGSILDLTPSEILLTASKIKDKYRGNQDGAEPSTLFLTPKEGLTNIVTPDVVVKKVTNLNKLSNALKSTRLKVGIAVGSLTAIGTAAALILNKGQMPEMTQNPVNPETNIQTTEMVAEQRPLGKALRPPSRPGGENKSTVATTEKSKIANTEAEAKTRVSFYRETDNNINTSVSQISKEINWDLALKVFDSFDKNKTFSTEFQRAGGYEGLRKIGAVIESDARNGIKTVEINMPRFKAAPIIPAIKK